MSSISAAGPYGGAPGCQDELSPIIEAGPSAARRVFAIYELAEAIFLEMPPRDVLINQRVCKDWRDVTVCSSPLQQAMFLKPADSCRYTFHGDQFSRSEHERSGRCFLQNPMLEYLADQTDHKSPRGMWRPEASWKQMLITQPAISSIKRGPRGDSIYEIENQDGVRLGDLGAKARGRRITASRTRKARKADDKQLGQVVGSTEDLRGRWERTNWLSGWQLWERESWGHISSQEMVIMMKGKVKGSAAMA